MNPANDSFGGDVRYPVHETFYSWQGEGAHHGRAAFFIRLGGCPVRCSWCDSRDTWNGGKPKAGRFTAAELLARVQGTRAEFVVITGGEPTIYDLAPLTLALRTAGWRIHLETCGGFPLRGEFDWVTVSPKRAALPLPTNLALASEYKPIIEDPADIAYWADVIAGCAKTTAKPAPVWLQPEWSHRDDPSVLGAITQWVLTHGAPYRAAWQLHKCYGAE